MEHKEVFILLVTYRKRKKLNDRQQQTQSFWFIHEN